MLCEVADIRCAGASGNNRVLCTMLVFVEPEYNWYGIQLVWNTTGMEYNWYGIQLVWNTTIVALLFLLLNDLCQRLSYYVCITR